MGYEDSLFCAYKRVIDDIAQKRVSLSMQHTYITVLITIAPIAWRGIPGEGSYAIIEWIDCRIAGSDTLVFYHKHYFSSILLIFMNISSNPANASLFKCGTISFANSFLPLPILRNFSESFDKELFISSEISECF